MDSFDEVFAAVKNYCKERLVDATYNLFIDGLEPLSFENGIVSISVRSDFIKGMVQERYADLLREAFSTILGFEVGMEFKVPEPTKPEAQTAVPTGSYAFTFENFIVGSTNKFAHAAAIGVSRNFRSSWV